MGLLEASAWYRSFRRNQTLTEWMKEQYSTKELEDLATANITESLHRCWVPWGEFTHDQLEAENKNVAVLSERLFKRYGNEILEVLVQPFLRASDPEWYESEADPRDEYWVYLNWVECFSKLPRAMEVRDRRTLIEFFVRNALAFTAREILEGKAGAWTPVPAVTVYREGASGVEATDGSGSA
jgi:hypothetical protein